ETEEKIERLNRVYAVLSGINGLIVRVHDREELFREACRMVLEVGKFPRAWIALVDRTAQRIRPVAWTGDGPNLEVVPLSIDPAEKRSYGLTGRAVVERTAMVANDMEN